MMSIQATTAIHPGLEALEDGFFMVDGDWRITYWNPTAARLFSVDRKAVLGRSLWGAVPPLAGSAVEKELERAMKRRLARDFRMPHLPGCCSGFFSVRAAPLEDGGLAVHFRDVTAETKLAERYSQLLESIRDGFVAVDADGTISYINSVAERLLRLPRARALGRQVWPFIPREPAAIADALRATLADGQRRQLRRIRPEGPVFQRHLFDLWVHPLPGGGISVLFQDVTRRVEREKALARYAADAEEVSRAKSRFFAAVSHELRTPLNALVGYTHLLSTDTYGELTPAATRAASRASVCAEHLARLIDDLLLMTSVETDRLPVVVTPVSLASFLPGATEPVRQQAEAKGLRFAIELDADLPVLETDPDRLRQLLHALLSNAVKFTNRGDVRLEVRLLAPVASTPAPDASTLPDYARNGVHEGVRIRVLDTGPGIPPEARDRIFEAFEQLGDPARSDSFQRGAGLGLTVARHLASLLQGSLVLESTGDAGSVFRLDLPRSLQT
jgi:PAS domain S-box-containing protein